MKITQILLVYNSNNIVENEPIYFHMQKAVTCMFILEQQL